MNMRAGRDELITTTTLLRDQVTVLQRSLEEEQRKMIQLQARNLRQHEARDVETAILQRSLHQSEAKVVQLETDAAVASDQARAIQAETQALRNELVDNEKTINKMNGEYETLQNEKKQLELAVRQHPMAEDPLSNAQFISPIHAPLHTAPTVETIYSATRTSLQRLQERQKILLLEQELANKETRLVETCHRVKTLERNLETVVTQLEEVESQRDHLRVATAHARSYPPDMLLHPLHPLDTICFHNSLLDPITCTYPPFHFLFLLLHLPPPHAAPLTQIRCPQSLGIVWAYSESSLQFFSLTRSLG